MRFLKQASLLLKRITSLENDIIEPKDELKGLKNIVSMKNYQEFPQEIKQLAMKMDALF